MYSVARNIAHVAIPKTGSSSARQALISAFGRDSLLFPGHLHMSQLLAMTLKTIGQPPAEFVAVVRHPEDWIVSGVNYRLRNRKGIDLAGICRDRGNVIWRRQCGYLDRRDLPLRLFPFERLTEAIQYMLGDEEAEIPHTNRSPQRVSLEEIFEHVGEDWFRQEYAKDYRLYEEVEGEA